MALNDILIRIRTAWEGQGAQSAAKGLTDVETAAARTAPAMNKAAGATRVSAEEFSRAARMASAAGGSMEGIGAIIQQLGSRIAGLAAAIPVIGLVFAAFTAWKTVITTLIERHREHERLLRSIKDSNAAGAIDSITKSYDRMTTAIERAAEEHRLFMEGQMEMVKVEQELTAAKLKSDETAELMAEPDATKQDAIRARYEALQQASSSGSDIAIQSMKADNVSHDISVAEQQLAAKQEKEPALLRIVAERGAAVAAADRSPEEKAAAQDAQAKAAAEVAKNRDEQSKLAAQIDRMRVQLNVELKRLDVMKLSGSDTQARQGMEVRKQEERVRVAETEAQRAAMEQQRGEAASQLLAWQAQAASAQSVIDAAQSRIDAGTFSAADNASAIQARSAAEDPIAQLTAFLTDLDAKLQLLTPPQPAAPAPAVQPVRQPAPAVQPVYQPAPAAPAPAFQVAPQMDSQSMQQAVDASQAQTALWQAQAASAQSVIDSAQSRIESGTFSAADNASAIQARSAAEAPIAQLTAVLTDLDAKLHLLTPPQPAAPAPAVQPVYQPAPAAPAPAFQVAPQMDSQSMQQAVDASQAQTALLQSFVDRIGREFAKQNEILRNNALIQ
jgi:hypothetical protein